MLGKLRKNFSALPLGILALGILPWESISCAVRSSSHRERLCTVCRDSDQQLQLSCQKTSGRSWRPNEWAFLDIQPGPAFRRLNEVFNYGWWEHTCPLVNLSIIPLNPFRFFSFSLASFLTQLKTQGGYSDISGAICTCSCVVPTLCPTDSSNLDLPRSLLCFL